MQATFLLKKAASLKQLTNFDYAFQTLQRVDVYSEDDSTAAKILYESALTAFLAGKPDICLSKLLELKSISSDEYAESIHIQTLEILALNEMRNWAEAHQKFLRFKDRYDKTMEDLYLNTKAYKMKSANKATNLSYLLPGMGQWYAGYFWKGFVSASINGGLVIFSGLSFLSGYYFSGAFTGLVLFYLFYNGGIRYAEVLVNQYNQLKANRFNDSVKQKLLATVARQ